MWRGSSGSRCLCWLGTPEHADPAHSAPAEHQDSSKLSSGERRAPGQLPFPAQVIPGGFVFTRGEGMPCWGRSSGEGCTCALVLGAPVSAAAASET